MGYIFKGVLYIELFTGLCHLRIYTDALWPLAHGGGEGEKTRLEICACSMSLLSE